jgi:hypothetical protein
MADQIIVQRTQFDPMEKSNEAPTPLSSDLILPTVRTINILRWHLDHAGARIFAPNTLIGWADHQTMYVIPLRLVTVRHLLKKGYIRLGAGDWYEGINCADRAVTVQAYRRAAR